MHWTPPVKASEKAKDNTKEARPNSDDPPAAATGDDKHKNAEKEAEGNPPRDEEGDATIQSIREELQSLQITKYTGYQPGFLKELAEFDGGLLHTASVSTVDDVDLQ